VRHLAGVRLELRLRLAADLLFDRGEHRRHLVAGHRRGIELDAERLEAAGLPFRRPNDRFDGRVEIAIEEHREVRGRGERALHLRRADLAHRGEQGLGTQERVIGLRGRVGELRGERVVRLAEFGEGLPGVLERDVQAHRRLFELGERLDAADDEFLDAFDQFARAKGEAQELRRAFHFADCALDLLGGLCHVLFELGGVGRELHDQRRDDRQGSVLVFEDGSIRERVILRVLIQLVDVREHHGSRLPLQKFHAAHFAEHPIDGCVAELFR
jgi:hypothetical protein